MAFPDDLLETARFLVEKESPTQATLRRAVSTAFYALFHLLIHDGCLNWARPEQRNKLARAFEHKAMLNAAFKQEAKYKKAAEGSIEKELFKVAYAFIQLQQKRELADYDFAVELSPAQAGQTIIQAERAFKSWDIIRHQQIAQDYLFSLLIRERSPDSPEWGN